METNDEEKATVGPSEQAKEQAPSAVASASNKTKTASASNKTKIAWILVILAVLALVLGLSLGLTLRDQPNNTQGSSAAQQGNDSTSDGDINTVAPEDGTPAPSATWPHEESDIAKDPNLRVGELDNGLRYMILPHPWPEGKVSFRLHIDAGSFMEDDDQLGYVIRIFILCLFFFLLG